MPAGTSRADTGSDRPMRILFVINSLGASGAEHSTAAMLPEMRALGHEVAVATLFDSGFGDEDRIRADGFDVRPLHSTGTLARIRELRSVIKRFAPDIVHTALYDSDQLGRLAAWRTGASVVSSLVNTPYDAERFRDPAIRRWKLRSVQALDAATARLFTHRLHAVSAGVATANAKALRISPAKIRVAERGRSRDVLGHASPERRRAVRSELGLAPETPVVLTAGRQEHQKAHVDLVAAVDLLAAEMPDVQVLLAGREGNATEDLRRALEAHPRAAAHIRLLGHRQDVPDLLAAADTLVISSRYEGTAGVAIEAMALECPVVCTDLAGVQGILTDEMNALLVPLSQPQPMADALRRVLSDEVFANRLRAQGLADFETRFTVRASAESMLALYRELLDDTPGGRRS